MVVFTAGKRRGRWGGGFDTWRNPPKQYSYMTFENAKVAKIGKGIFFKLN